MIIHEYLCMLILYNYIYICIQYYFYIFIHICTYSQKSCLPDYFDALIIIKNEISFKMQINTHIKL